jgi:hypothetical protein
MSVRVARFVLPLVAVAAVATGAAGAPADDAYIAGYAAAVLEREFKVIPRSLAVKDGVITLDAAELGRVDADRVTAALSGIRGAVQVRVVRPEPGRPEAAAPSPSAGPLAAGQPAKPATLPTGFLPEGQLFDPLLADPRWPHFSASYQYYLRDSDFKNVGSGSFGETIILFRADGPFGGQREVGLQASVFAIFDLDAPSTDLINADYFVAGLASYRLGQFQALGRAFHQSSHLGDEFLLRSREDRVNLSYEGVDLKLSYHLFGRVLRVYGGGGYLIHREPSELDPWSTQAGIELQSPWTLLRGALRPVAAADVQNRQENDWKTDLSLRAGVQFESVQVLDRKLQLMLEYFNGHSPNGQFYRERIEYLGIGVHLYY